MKNMAVPFSNRIDDYLKADEIINYHNDSITSLADSLYKTTESKVSYIEKAYEYVRDNIPHSSDAGKENIPFTAQEVLKEKHGICFAKAHLLVALLRCKAIPSGFCYQKVILFEEQPNKLAYHGLVGVYLEKLNKWIRLDPGEGGQFLVDAEQLVFQVREELGEIDSFVVYPVPDVKILEKMRNNKTLAGLLADLPTELAYHT